MEELLCQVQDVYGDESLALLDFEDGDDEEVYPPNRSERTTSTAELTEFPSTDSVDGSLNNSMERVEPLLMMKRRYFIIVPIDRRRRLISLPQRQLEVLPRPMI
ncbi:unnamed protein product [Rodentolepis nana]|uniref:Uncharacterized protein n=1 Tax=Rodentolepis nana TaxID=102285 RepID=A0A0R3TIF5_RODNA|nr:unnamed protein product [Rodentolepis nana]